MAHPSTPLDPTKLSSESVFTRRTIIAAYWLVVLLAVPLWWTTTSIDRLSLPTARVFAQQDKQLTFPVHVCLSTQERDLVDTAAALAREVQQLLEAEREVQERSGLRIYVDSRCDSESYEVEVGSGMNQPTVEGRRLRFELNESSLSTAAMQLTDALLTLLAPYVTLRARNHQTERVMKYAPRYRLAFSLLNEDATSENSVQSWDVERALSRHISPVLDKLSLLHNFTVESQVQFHAPLAFEPIAIPLDGKEAYGLSQEHLTVFVNSAEWTLSSSVSNDPVVHFVLFIPSSGHSPLGILDSTGQPTTSKAFILPQWGGINLHDPSTPSPAPDSLIPIELDEAFTTFRHQLMTLLGVPELSKSIRSRELLTGWQLDALLRRRAIENAQGSKDTLQSIVQLVRQIENMPVGQDVRDDVQGALNALEATYSSATASPLGSIEHSKRAITLASRAFFNPGMLALLYFPAEHKYAVYTPLFGSVAAPLLASILRELMAWRRARRAATQEAKNKAAKQKSD
ncbi:hypothetical protein CERSUDRAFT_116191 [Gelatoporia subvermispora B]|uniref:GPI transamidase component PIG-S n=1 Tax=Ceriporiopsis subvermispora (strain B) TaxID=914234 RepID=M2RAH9_CERS8|nr:hypothetical protein CERSUDRAFT_116191 [Gelatoporia subvermispora B]